jgi:TonB family protein
MRPIHTRRRFLVPRFLVPLLCALGLSGAAAAAPAPDEPVVAGQGGIAAPKRTKTVPPVYPPEALAKGIRGIVILEVVIDKEGKVASADVIRSIPLLDEAALSAVRKWEYDVTKVDGKPVSVRLTVPITFALKLPEVTRQEGIPELRQGAPVAVPAAELHEPVSVTAEVTLDPEGTIAEADVVKGTAPWSVSLMQALRTWRFASDGSNAVLSFRVEADFLPAAKGAPAHVELRLNSLRRSEAMGQSAPAAPTATTLQAPPAPEAPAATPPVTTAPATAPPATAPATTTPATSAEPPAATTAKAPATPPVPSNPPPAAAPTATAPPAAATPAPAAPERTVKEAPTQGAPPTTKPVPPPPAVEVITAPPSASAPGGTPAPPPTPGISAIRDVTLDLGVPDLTRGHRPAPPPFARMGGVTGVVEVTFSVDAAGQTLVQATDGPDLLKPAAQDMVSTWVFRRTTAERLRLVAEVTYGSDTATAKVRTE